MSERIKNRREVGECEIGENAVLTDWQKRKTEKVSGEGRYYIMGVYRHNKVSHTCIMLTAHVADRMFFSVV